MITRKAIARTLAVACALTAALALSVAAPAFAHLIDYQPVATFGTTGTEAGQFEWPTGLAVDESDGDVYVADAANVRVERFEANGTYVSQLDGSETPGKAFSEPTYVAVDNSTGAGKGRVYVGDRGARVVDVFGPTGEYLFQIPVQGLLGITVDSSGHLWSWTNQPAFTEYDETGTVILFHHIPTNIGSNPGIAVDSRGDVYVLESECPVRYSPPAFQEVYEFGRRCQGSGLAIDPTSGTLFQDGRSEIIEWPPYGEGPGLWERSEETITGAFTYSEGIAVDGKTGQVYVSDRFAKNVEVFDGVPAISPTIEGNPIASNTTRSSTVIHAMIDPHGSHTDYRVHYVEAAVFAPSATDPYEAGTTTPLSRVTANSGAQEVEQAIEGLRPGTTYHYEVVAVNQAGSTVASDETFTTGSATPPSATTGAADGIAQNVATINGVLNTNGLPTTYGFEIGTSTDYGPPTGLGSVGAGLAEAPVSLSLSGLLPGTTYHYRLAATNVDGTSYGEDRTFTTSTFPETFIAPPAALPFVAVPTIAFPAQASAPVAKTKAKTKRKKVKRHAKHGRSKRKAKGKKK